MRIMKNKSLFKILSMLWICSMIFTACMSDVELSKISKDILIDESLVVPVGVDTIKIKELLQKLSTDNQVTTDPAGQGTEIYFEKEEKYDYDFRDISLLKNNTQTTVSFQPSPGGSISVPANSAIPSANLNTSFNLGLNSDVANERVDKVLVTKATLNLALSFTSLNLLPANMTVTLTFPTDRVTLANGTSSMSFVPTSLNSNIDILNFTVNMPANATSIPVNIKIDAKNGNTTQTVSPASKINTTLKFTQFNFSVAYGFFKPAVIVSKTQQIPLDVSSYLPDAFLRFANPQAIITAKTNVGTYVQFRIDYIKAFLKSNPAASTAKANFSGKDYYDFNLPKPAVFGDSISKTVTFDSQNARTDLLFDNAIRPDVLEYQFSTYVNQDSLNAHPLVPLFFPSAGMIKTTVKVKIPLYLKAGSNVNWNDTIYINGGTIGDKIDNSVIDSSALVFKVTNGLPIKATLRFALIDSNGAKINTTLDDTSYVINAPTISADGKVVTSSLAPQTIKVNVSKTQFEDLKKAKSVIFNVAADGKDSSTAIHFTTTDSFIVRLGVFVKGNTVRNLNNN